MTRRNSISLKYRKYHKFKFYPRNSLERFFFKPSGLCTVGLQALECGRVTVQQMEACRVAINRNLRFLKDRTLRSKSVLGFGIVAAYRWGVEVRVFPCVPVTRKSVAVRMGSGKGKTRYWICPVRKGQILCEMRLPYKNLSAFFSFWHGSQKLPIKAQVVFLIY